MVSTRRAASAKATNAKSTPSEIVKSPPKRGAAVSKNTPQKNASIKDDVSIVNSEDSAGNFTFKNVAYDGKQKKKFKNLKQIMEHQASVYGNDEAYRRFNCKCSICEACTNWLDTSIEAAPSLKPRHKYCDITGLIAHYTDPKSGLRYHSAAVYQYIRTLSPDMIQQYLRLRNAHTIVK